MLIKDLNMHCGECSLVSYCGDPYEYAICTDKRFQGVDEKLYEDIVMRVSFKDFKGDCKDCKDQDSEKCEDCDGKDEEKRYMADKVVEMLARIKDVKRGALYKHFKGNLYEIIGIAEHTENDEPLVIYHKLWGSNEVYARPLAMFLSEVESDNQKYRFELIGE